MKYADVIFNNKPWKMTSAFGARSVIKTSAGNTSTYHQGTDYSTNKEHWEQYALEDGYCFVSGKATNDGALYAWIIYPRLKKAMLHYHLHERATYDGWKVKAGTLIGTTGMTGKATGIHLHLGVRDLSRLTTKQINNMTWDLLRSCPYIDPHAQNYTKDGGTTTTTKSTKIEGAKSKNSSLSGTYKATANVHIRAGAGASKTDLGIIKAGETVKNYGYFTNVNGVNWLYVAYADKVGFVCSTYLRRK